MTLHDDLCVRAARWLAGTMRCGVVLTEFVSGCPETPDAFGWTMSGMISHLVEVKTSRSDFAADAKKPSRRHHTLGPGRLRWYFTPAGLVRPDEIPAGWGLAEVHGRRVRRLVEPERRDEWSQGDEMAMAYSVMRRTLHGLGAEVVVRKALLGGDE